MTSGQSFSRGIDYLETLGNKLRDLQGYRALAGELIQNADDARVGTDTPGAIDAPGATWMSFDATDDALVVDDDGVFSDCGHMKESECPWKQEFGKRCDFHRFRHVGGGDKRGETGTTGAFGIGFIAVYQITDVPELISHGRHWIVREELSEDKRIYECPGCDKCRVTELPGTRIILPWARVRSELRTRLAAAEVANDAPVRLVEELRGVVPEAMIFLKNLNRIEIKRNGDLTTTFRRTVLGRKRVIGSDEPGSARTWHIVRGNFDRAAAELRTRYGRLIEDKRTSSVELAITEENLGTGLLYAVLPTQQDLGLPFHINADFYPTNDRKNIILDGDYQSEWNRAALGSAAIAFGLELGKLIELLGAERFWQILSRLQTVSVESRAQKEAPLAQFWSQAKEWVGTIRCVPTVSGDLVLPSEALVMVGADDDPAISVLGRLGMRITNDRVRPYRNTLTAAGVGAIDLSKVTNHLISLGLTSRMVISALPQALVETDDRSALWATVADLLGRISSKLAKKSQEDAIRDVALAPGRDGALWPFRELFRADEDTIEVFEALDLPVQFLREDSSFARLSVLCPEFGVTQALDALELIGDDALANTWSRAPATISALYSWFSDRISSIRESPNHQRRLARLSLFPAAGALHEVRDLWLPGEFDDPLGLAGIVDLNAFGNSRDLLRAIGMRELVFRDYVAGPLVNALGNPSFAPEKRREAILLVARLLGEIKDHEEVRNKLKSVDFCECQDGRYRVPAECYFHSDSVRVCLGQSAHYVAFLEGHDESVRDVYAWLGVERRPRFEDIGDTVSRLAEGPVTSSAIAQVYAIVDHLAERVGEPGLQYELRRLRLLKWLPASNDQSAWYAPSELFASFRKYLFESQARFVDLPVNVQQRATTLFQILNLRDSPTPEMVVKHLRWCASRSAPVNLEVYRFLQDSADDQTLAALRDVPCLYLGDSYHHPHAAFWSEHGFGPYRLRLPDWMRGRFKPLFDRLGVRDTPVPSDAIDVLKEISSRFGDSNTELDDETLRIVMPCWRMLEDAMAVGDKSVEEAIRSLTGLKCVPNARRVLKKPETVFVLNRAGLAERFGEMLVENVIERPLQGGRAYEAAGVRPLSSVIHLDLKSCIDETDDLDMPIRLQGRLNSLARVLSTRYDGAVIERALPRLAAIRWMSAGQIVVEFRFNGYQNHYYSDPESISALFTEEDDTVRYVKREGEPPWPSIARELAIALFPDADPGEIAANLKEVLASTSGDAASESLDELGLPRIDTTAYAPVMSEQVSEFAGQVSFQDPGEQPPISDATAVTTQPPAESPDTVDAARHVVLDGQSLPTMSAGQAIEAILGTGAPQPTAAVPDASAGPATQSATGTGASAKRTGTSGSRPFHSYIAVRLHEQPDEGENDHEHNLELEARAIEFILEQEPNLQRTGKNNPGFDLFDQDGEGVANRWVEVKATAHAFSTHPVAMSRKQFAWAQEKGPKFWLYVVERLEEDNPRIYRIQDPAGLARYFAFDSGWRVIDAPVRTPAPEPKPEE